MKIIKQYLIENSYEHLTEGKAWKFFKKSDYYEYSIDDLKELGEGEELKENIRSYAHDFGMATRYLNLF